MQYAFPANVYRGSAWFLLMGAYYAMYPYWYLLFFDVLRIRDGKNWYRRNIYTLLCLTILAFVAVALILAVGQTFSNGPKTGDLRQKYYVLYTLVFLFTHFPLIVQEDVLSILRQEHSHLARAYLFVGIVVFVVGAVVLMGEFG